MLGVWVLGFTVWRFGFRVWGLGVEDLWSFGVCRNPNFWVFAETLNPQLTVSPKP